MNADAIIILAALGALMAFGWCAWLIVRPPPPDGCWLKPPGFRKRRKTSN